MSIYLDSLKEYPQKDGKNYRIYIRFNHRVDANQLAKEINRKITDRTDFGSDHNNSLSMSYIYKYRCKNFMLKMKKLLLKDSDIKEVRINKI